MSLTFLQTQLPNGLTVIGERNPDARSVGAGYFVRAGARDETAEVAGVSHFLEHMMFKGTARRSAEDINREFDELGARYNAYTSEERTVYYGAVLPGHRERLLDLLTDMMRPALREEDFELEKKVILEEIAMYEDRPHVRVFDEGNRRFYGGHPVGNTILGTPDTIGPLEPAAMRAYFEERYAPDNLVLVLAGAFDWDAAVEQVRRSTEDWTPRRAGRRHPEFDPRPGDERLLDDALQRVHTALYAPGVSALDERRYAAGLLASCLGDVPGSRLYWALVDRGLADAASLSHDAAEDVGAFIGYLSAAPERADEVLAIARDELLRAQRDGLGRDEWERAQRKLATGLTLRGETPYGRLMSLGASFLTQRRYRPVAEVVDRILSTPLEAGQALLDAKPFDRLFTMTLGPEGSA